MKNKFENHWKSQQKKKMLSEKITRIASAGRLPILVRNSCAPLNRDRF
jgi:hypothetical protein